METKRQQKVGIVTSNKMQKTVVVTVERQVNHPLYKRVVRRSKKFMAHDEKNECHPGDTVRIEETRPLSARKRWRVVQVIARAAQVAPLPESVL
ncbi:MAG TPA: 30S ribosomal protein S17 [Terriglobia bacterium]|jgi:small subunit ribosomal protein S17|nr:30S ribosomal protein S17 [Terriglobia bacterium]